MSCCRRRPCRHSLLQRALTLLLDIPTAADALPGILSTTVTNGKTAALALVPVVFCFDLLLLPFWMLSFLLTECGIYVLVVWSIFLLGRFIVRLIAFPGASHRVYGEMEGEFQKYSVNMLENATGSILDVASAVSSVIDRHQYHLSRNGNTIGDMRSNHDISLLWRRAVSYRDRVLGMYCDVFKCLLEEDGSGVNDDDAAAFDATPLATERSRATLSSGITSAYGNNRLVGDIGKLTSVTHQARVNGRALYEVLKLVLLDIADFERKAFPLATSSAHSAQSKPVEVQLAAQALVRSTTELKDMLPSMKALCPSSTLSNGADDNNEQEEQFLNDSESNVKSTRRATQDEGVSSVDTIKAGISSLMPMLDPPPHASIFGLDVLRGCVLSRYSRSRQLWVQRPTSEGGGMLDVMHIPSSKRASRIEKAVLYCNPNAGLTEVATGMSVIGGNIDCDGCNNENSWTDFYTEKGYDVFLFNYAGFGRSYGGNRCGIGCRHMSYKPGVFQRIKRIFCGSLMAFKPTPMSMKADALAVATYIAHDIGADHLVIHGESIGGMAASYAARQLSAMSRTTDGRAPTRRTQPSLLICDRTFCNLNAVAQRLVGKWTGPAISLLTPFWNTDVAGDFIAAQCSKVVAQDAGDSIIHHASSLRAGLAAARELQRGSTKQVGVMIEAPVEYRMADWEGVSVFRSKFVTTYNNHRIQPPVWPADKHIALKEAFHFAACVRRIGKMATAANRGQTTASFGQSDEEEGIEITEIMRLGMDSRETSQHSLTPIGSIQTEMNTNNLVIDAWKALACCDGLTGMSLGATVKEGCDCTVSWLCSTVTFGGQVISDAVERREMQNKQKNHVSSDAEITVTAADFDVRLGGNTNGDDEIGINMVSIPEVITTLKRISIELTKLKYDVIEFELQYCIGMLNYVVDRLTSKLVLSESLQIRHFQNIGDILSVGCFLNLRCGHNNQYSTEEREKLLGFLNEACIDTDNVL